jgi:hypothetical protein
MRMKSLLLCGAVSCAPALLPVTVQAQAQSQAQANSDHLDKVDQLQWEFITRKLFAGLSAPPLTSPLIAPSTTNNIVMTSFRYYPKYPTF